MANSYLNRTTGSPSNADKITISAWIKRTKPGAEQVIIGEYGSSTNRSKLQFKSDNKLEYYQVDGGSATVQIRTNRVFRDTSAFYHIVMQYDSAQSTSSDRLKIYVNGTQETSLSVSTYPPQNQDTRLNKSGVNLHIGQDGNSGNYFEGYISHIALVDNAISAPTVFGETDSTSGIWKFKSPTGVTWGTNGFHLKFENSGALGTDSSGNSNTFTVNGNLKQALDTPSNVYCTLNPNDKYAAALTNGNTTVTNEDNNQTIVLSTLAVNSGKWYWEAKINDTASDTFNVGIRKTGLNNYAVGSVAYDANAWVYAVDGNIYHDSSSLLNTGTTATVGDIIGFILDLDAGTLKLQKNGSNIYSGNAVVSSLNTGDYYHVHQGAAQAQVDFNFGNGFFGTTAISSAGSNGNGSLFEYDVPSNHYAINTKNINTYG